MANSIRNLIQHYSDEKTKMMIKFLKKRLKKCSCFPWEGLETIVKEVLAVVYHPVSVILYYQL